MLAVLVLIASFAEILGIGAILPFLGALTAPERLFEHPRAQPLIELLGLTEPRQLLLPMTVLFGLAALISGVMRLLLLWANTRMGHAIGADLSIQIYRRTLYQPYAVHCARNSSEVIAGISNKVASVVGNNILPSLTLVSSCAILFMILSALLAIDPQVALIAFTGFGSIYGLVILFTKKRLRENSLRINREYTQVIKALQEGLGGIRDVLLDGSQETYCRIYRNADLPLRKAQANLQILGGSPRYAIEALGMLLIAGLAYALSQGPDGLVSSIPVLGALALGAQRMLPAMQQAYGGWSQIRGGQAALQDTLVLLKQPLPVHQERPALEPLPFKDKFELHAVSFRYAPGTPLVLQQIDLKIPKGARIGFIGATGSGKSTLLDLVMSLLEPSSGQLLVDGVVITAENRRAWQAHLAHVPQAIYLADASIEENIAFGVPLAEIDRERVRAAARQAQIAETIEQWKDGYRTPVGERGVRLSGGQRQRIGIARALYKKADVIVFDEATSALDNETEAAVMQAIEGLGKDLTILIVAHRLSTLRGCERIVALKDGRIEKIGSYAEMVEKALKISKY